MRALKAAYELRYTELIQKSGQMTPEALTTGWISLVAQYRASTKQAKKDAAAERADAAQVLRILRGSKGKGRKATRLLSNAQVARLLESLREEFGIREMLKTWPATTGDERKGLEDLKPRLIALAQGLRTLAPLTAQRLQLGLLEMLGDVVSIDAVALNLEALAICADSLQHVMPAQSRRSSHVSVVARVHSVAPDLTVSDKAATPFYRAVQASLMLLGVWNGKLQPSPAASIRAYRAAREQSRPR